MKLKSLLVICLLAAVVAGSTATLVGEALVGRLRIASPDPQATVSGTITVLAQGEGVADLQYVIFGVDEQRPLATNARPFAWKLDTTTLANGPHTLVVDGHGRYGLVASAEPVTIIVRNGGAPQAPEATGSTPPPVTPPAQVTQVAVAPAAPAPATQPLATPCLSAGTGEASVSLLVSIPVEGPVTDGLPALCLVQAAMVAPVIQVCARESAAPTLAVNLDGVELADISPVLQSGQAMVGFRSLVAALGGSTRWLHATKQAIGRKGGRELVLTPGSRRALVDGKQVEMAAPARLSAGRTLAPLRFCSQQFGLQVAWDDTGRITLSSGGTAVASAR